VHTPRHASLVGLRCKKRCCHTNSACSTCKYRRPSSARVKEGLSSYCAQSITHFKAPNSNSGKTKHWTKRPFYS
jgi:hypothetical protein